jgi:Domain of unknown function (DUF4504)
MERLVSIVRSHFKRHWKIIAIQIHAVNSPEHPKRGFLFDCGAVEAAVLMKVIEQLRAENQIERDVSLVFLKDDVFILNRSKFLKETPQVIVDISWTLEKPKTIENSQIAIMFDEIKNQLRESDGKISMRIEACDDWCIPTVFGFLINYPVIYWHDPRDDRNCLGLVELKVFQILSQDAAIISFSVPNELYEQDPFVRDSVDKWLEHFQSSGEFEIKTFTAKHSTVIL